MLEACEGISGVVAKAAQGWQLVEVWNVLQ